MTTVANCTLLPEAQIIRATLESYGLKAYIPDELTVETAPHWALPMGGIRVQVEDEDAATARGFLALPPAPQT